MSFHDHPAIAIYQTQLAALKAHGFVKHKRAAFEFIGKVTTVALKTQRLVGELPPLFGG